MACRYTIKKGYYSLNAIKTFNSKEETAKWLTDDWTPFQLEGQKQSKASQATIAQMKEFLKRIGVDYQVVSDIVVNGKKVGANGIARIMQNLVEVVDGKEGAAITEEAMHFAVELLEKYNPTLYKSMFNSIGNYNIWRDTLNTYREVYTKDGKPDVPRIKKEAIAKLLAEHVIQENEGATDSPLLLERVDTFWRKIKEWFLNLINKTEYNPFREAAKEILAPQEFYQIAPAVTLAKANEDLDRLLIDYLKPFGVTFRTLDSIKTKLGTDSLGVTDVVNKLISVVNNRNIETVPEEVGHMITFLMGQQHPLMKELFNYIPNWSEYKRVEAIYGPEYKNEKQVHIEAIGQLLAKAFVRNYTGAKEVKGLLDRILDWLSDFFLGDFGNSYPTKIADKIALQILAGKTDLIDNSISPNLRPLNFDKALAANPLANRIKNKFTTGKFSDFKVTGSLAIAKQGLIYRDENESIHDIDFIAHGNDERLAELNKEMEDIGAVPIHAGWKHDNFVTYSYIVPKEGEKVENVERDARNWIRSYSVGGKTYKYTDTSKDAMAVDFFWYPQESERKYFEDVSSFAHVFKGKLFLSPKKSAERMYQRPKDQKDFVLFQPSYIGESDEEFLYYQIAPQQSSNPKADDMKVKLKEKKEVHKVEKVIDDKAIEEDDRNYYRAQINDKEVRPERTTEWAKNENLRKNGGRDFMASATDKMKAIWAQFADYGTAVHKAIEDIIADSTDSEGRLKKIEDINIRHNDKIPAAVHKALVTFLLGSSKKGVKSFLGQFPEGTVFLTEQVVFNEKAGKKGRAGTIDLMAIQPDGKIKVYDWKTMQLKEGDQAFQKQGQHALQLIDYRRTLREAYGEKDVEAYTVPIGTTYVDAKNGDKVLQSVKIGDVNVREEKNTFLLPVIPDDQSTGNPIVDDLVKSLRAQYKRMYNKRVAPEDKDTKIRQLNQLAIAIRNIHVALNFEPLAIESKNFINNIGKSLKKFDAVNLDSLSKEEEIKLLEELIQLGKAAHTYSEVDEAFVSEYGTKDLSKEKEAILDQLKLTAATVGVAKTDIQNRLNVYVAHLANKHGIEDILSPEREVKGVLNDMLESGNIAIRTLNLLTKLNLESKSEAARTIKAKIKSFGDLYQDLVKEAGSTNPMELVGDIKTMRLKKKIKPEFWDSLNEALEKKDKSFILKNIDLVKYKELVKEKLKKRIADINDEVHSTVDAENEAIKKRKIQELPLLFNITNDKFIGWQSHEAFQLIKKSIKEADHLSEDYKALQKQPAALAMWEFLTELNRKAFSLGYLANGASMSFLPLIQGTIIERISQSQSTLREAGALIKDGFTVQVHEEQAYGKTDPETNKPVMTIPKPFTFTDKTSEQLSHDLLKIVPIYIRALEEYSAAKELEMTALAVQKVEENKDHLEIDANGNVIFKAGKPEAYRGNEVNSAFVERYVNDAVYFVKQDSDTAIDIAVGKFSKGTEEQKERRVLNTKKALQEGNTLTQALAVGLKLLVAIPNYMGVHIQSAINSGGFYTYGEYLSEHRNTIGSVFKGHEGNVMKGLMDLIVPLNEDVTVNEQRKIAWKQSKLKWLGTWTFQDVMMSSNRLPDVAHQLTNARAWAKNTMVVDGKLVNIRQYLKQQDLKRYKGDPSQIREVEKSLDKRVEELRETKGLHKVATFNSEGYLEIPGVSEEEISSYRVRVIEYGRKLTSQMSQENKAAYRRNIIATSFMMFKNWIPKQVAIRTLDIQKDAVLGEWQYGRGRVFVKTLFHLGFKNIMDIRDISQATPKGLQIMRDMLEQKREDYYKKTGQELTISEEEFFDLIRTQLQNQYKELGILVGLAAMVLTTKMAAPDDDEDPLTSNRYKWMAKAANKIMDELAFYYIPTSAESITNGSLFPSLGLLSKLTRFFKAFGQEITGRAVQDEEMTEKAKPLKHFINMIPVASQWMTEILPYYDPEMAKEMGVKVSAEARAMR